MTAMPLEFFFVLGLGLSMVLVTAYYASSGYYNRKYPAVAGLYAMFERILYVHEWPVRVRRFFITLCIFAVPLWFVVLAVIGLILFALAALAVAADIIAFLWNHKSGEES